MEKFPIALLGAIFVILMIGSIEPIYADHLLSDEGIFKDEYSVNHVSTIDPNSKYHIHLQIEVKNMHGQLVSISESNYGKYIPHKISDNTFDTKLGEKEIIIIDDIKYEKVQYTDTVNIKNTMREIFPHYWGLWGVQLCGQVDGHESPCFHVFQVSTPLVSYTEGDIVISHWTVLRGID